MRILPALPRSGALEELVKGMMAYKFAERSTAEQLLMSEYMVSG